MSVITNTTPQVGLHPLLHNQLQNLSDEVFIATDYSVVADGTGDGLTGTDNYAAIQTLFADVNTAGGGRIVWPRGYIFVDRYITVANGLAKFELADCDGVIFDAVGTKFDFLGAFNRTLTTDWSCGFSAIGGSGLTILGGDYDGNADQMTRTPGLTEGRSHGWMLRGVTDVSFVGVPKFHHWPTDGLYLGTDDRATPSKVCQRVVGHVLATSNSRNNLTLAGINSYDFIGSWFDLAGFNNADGTATSPYGYHNPGLGVDCEPNNHVGTTALHNDLISGHGRFTGGGARGNINGPFSAELPNKQEDITLDNFEMDGSTSISATPIVMAVPGGRVIDCDIDTGPWQFNVLAQNSRPLLAAASYAAGLITFDTGTAFHMLRPGQKAYIDTAAPSAYNGLWTVQDAPTDTTFRVRASSDPTAYVSGGKWRRQITTLVRGGSVRTSYRGLLCNAADYVDAQIENVDFIGTHDDVATSYMPYITDGVSRFVKSKIHMPAVAHDGTTTHTVALLENIGELKGTRFETDLALRGDPTLSFVAALNGSVASDNTFASGTYFEGSGAMASSLLLNSVYETTLSMSFGDVADEKKDIYFDGPMTGALSVQLVAGYNGANVVGSITKRFALSVDASNTFYKNVSEITEVLGAASTAFAISDLTWDGTRYRIQIVHRDSIHETIDLRVVFHGQTSDLASSFASSFGSGAIYTDDPAVFPAPVRTGDGSLVLATAALGTTATDGFLYIAGGAGTPTGVPTAQTGTYPLYWDHTNKKLYIYDGAWLGGTAPGVFS